ncbi:MAG TPA: ATP-binding cassette domain-containing protein, partial [Spirochaetes bacterium]|nr:ATP-binding cassette domain-containing protein [Spirochaetota bacterium]
DILRLEKVSFQSEYLGCLREVSFSLFPGENLVVFGPENSGTEAICPVIAGLEEEFEGEIYYRGRPVRPFDYFEKLNYRKELGYLQKNYGLINNMSVEENISLPLQYHSRLDATEVRAEVDRFIEELRLEHCRHRRPVALTAAETLKTAFCRAIALDPRLLLVEHSLEGQCLLNALGYLETLEKWARRNNKSVIFVTYEPERFVEFSDKFIMLYDGRTVFEGNRAEFVAENDPYLSQYRRSLTVGPMKVL